MKPKWTPIKVRLGQIQAWEGNPRMSTKAQAQRIIQSERKFGQPVPFLVAPENNGRFLLYDGHQRLSAWFTVYGADYKMDAMVSDRPLTDEEHKELIITLHTGATGSWDWDALAGWSAGDLQEWGMNTDALKGWNNDANNLKELLNAETAEPVDAEPQIDRAEILQKKWKTESGQLWKLGEHRLLIGDCTVRENVERLMGGERADMVFTDPPFGNNKGYGRGQLGVRYIEGDQNTDILFKLPEIIDSVLDGSFSVVWVQWYTYMDLLSAFSSKEIDTVIVWDKKSPGLSGGGGYGEQYEMAVVFVNGNPKHSFFRGNVFTESRHVEGGERNPHPTMKSVKVCQDIIVDLSTENKIIVDFFAGSGTTIIAAHNLNRRCYAMEISEKYGAVILERFQNATGITPELVE